MSQTTKLQYNFAKGFMPDGGPFFAAEGYFRDGKNVSVAVTGEAENRPGIELLNEQEVLTLTDSSTASYVDVPSTYYAEFAQTGGLVLKAIFLRIGKYLFIYCNDGVTYTNSLTNLSVNTPDFNFTLPDVSPEARYHKTTWAKDGNTVTMTNARSPIYKIIWGNKTTGTDTFTTFRVELTEINEDLFELQRAPTKGKSIIGWFSREVPMATGTTSYIVDEYITDAAPGYVVTIFLIDANNNSTALSTADYAYTEVLDTTINLLTATITYTAAVSGTKLRIYFGRQAIEAFKPS